MWRESQQRWRLVGLLLGLVVLAPSLGWSQGQVGPYDACRNTQAIADITVSTVAVTVITANQSLCGAVIVNRTGQPIRCRGIRDGVPTATLGTVLESSSIMELRLDAQQGWACIRDANATDDAIVNITYLFP